MAFFSTDKSSREQWDRRNDQVRNGLRNFMTLGEALKEIRDQQLYRYGGYKTFDDCCHAEWKISAQHAARLIAAFDTANEIGPVGQQLSERQLRPLTQLPPDVLSDAVEEALSDGGSTEAFEKAAAKRRPRKKKSGPLKPLRLKVPGGTVVITPNRKAESYSQMLQDALSIYHKFHHQEAA